MAYVEIYITEHRNLTGTISKWVLVLGGKLGQRITKSQAQEMVKEFNLKAGKTEASSINKRINFKTKYS